MKFRCGAQVTEIQEGHGVQLVELTDSTGEISQRVNKVNQAAGWVAIMDGI